MRHLLAAPMPVDVVRDGWDVASFWVAAGSAFIGAIALILAYRAIREAAGARQAVANERRRTFELETLRDILQGIDDLDQPELLGIEDLAHSLINRRWLRLGFFGEDEFPAWRAIHAGADLLEVLPETEGERAKLKHELDRESGHTVVVMAAPFGVQLIRRRLAQDVSAAIAKRMAERD